ncbi:MAG: ABC transporter permease [Pseudomonadaceae bacterium]|nr:ABC transporter permease [Pseudomonadaceae bacterium]
MRFISIIVYRHIIALNGAWAGMFCNVVLEPLVFLVGFGFGFARIMAGEDINTDYLTFVLPGMMLWSSAATAIIEGSFTVHRRCFDLKLWQAWLATPLTLPWLLAGETTAIALRCFVSSLVMLLMGALLGAHINLWWLAILPLILLVCVAHAAMGMWAASLATKRDQLMAMWVFLGSTTLIFGGALTPTTTFPSWVNAIFSYLPTPHALAFIRPMADGTLAFESLWYHGAMLALITVCSVALALTGFMRRLYKEA